MDQSPQTNQAIFRNAVGVFGFLALFMGLLACTGNLDGDDQTWGRRGTKPGLFSSPRAIEAGAFGVAIIDRTGRVQCLSHEGEWLHEWVLPKIDNGTPTCLAIQQDGTIWIPDTHNSRILHYDLEGNLLLEFGTYGEDDGQFIYPTDLTIGSDGYLYITEYGFKDRVQVFTAEGEYVRQWGQFGTGDEDFNRPMAIVSNGRGDLYVADSVNHRVKHYTEDGTLVNLFGSQGEARGQFEYPYDLTLDEQGNIYVVEFANHRVQAFTPEGDYIKTYGSMGSGQNQLIEPWGIGYWQNKLYVADTRNHRITIFDK